VVLPSVVPGAPLFPEPQVQGGPPGRTVAEITYWAEKAAGGAAVRLVPHRPHRTPKAADKLAEWIANPNLGQLAVVTGGPGTGKSTLLALPVLLTNPVGRENLLDDTGENSPARIVARRLRSGTAMVAVHARGLNIDKVAEQIAAGLGWTPPQPTTYSRLSKRTRPIGPR